MLEQYRKEFPQEEKDPLLDTESSIGKRKLLFILSGAAFALFFFLFLMGIFRNEEEHLVQTEIKAEITKEQLLVLEEKLQTLLARLDKVEADLARKSELQFANPVASKQEMGPQKVPQVVTQTVDVAVPEDAVAMTNQALKGMLEKNVVAALEEKALEEAQAKKSASSKVAKAKTKKAKDKASKDVPAKESVAKIDPNAPTNLYVVQKGDTLSKISVRYYGTPNRWRAIYEANREKINNINSLKVGTTIVIPQK